MSLTLRTGTPDDIARGGVICYEAFASIAGQHNFPRDFETVEEATGLMTLVLSDPRIYTVVAELGGKSVGCSSLWETGPIAGVGPVIVDPAVQNGAIGRSMMEHLVARAKSNSAPGVRLVQAAFHNRSMALYTKLGFDAREPLSHVVGPPINRRIPGYDVRPVTDADVDHCNALCRHIHGHDRNWELRGAVMQGSAALVERHGRITGYATAIGFFAHAVGLTNDDLFALIAAAPTFGGHGPLIPTRDSELLRWCLAQGLRIRQPMTLMTMGLYNEPCGAYLPSILF